jgi:hypothetical protein
MDEAVSGLFCFLGVYECVGPSMLNVGAHVLSPFCLHIKMSSIRRTCLYGDVDFIIVLFKLKSSGSGTGSTQPREYN